MGLIFSSRRWFLTTLLVLAGMGVMIRLGLWQLDRLEQRKAFNLRVTTQMGQPLLDLNTSQPKDPLFDMEYRSAVVRGEFDFTQEVLLRNQVNEARPGFHVLTPLHIAGSDAWVLVNRGWIPIDQAAPEKRAQFQEPGVVTVQGMLRRPQTEPDFGGIPDPTLAVGQVRLEAWNIVNLQRIQTQVSGQLLLVYLQQAPQPGRTALPARSLPELDLTEGSHLGYALQWFSFAGIFVFGYINILRRSEKGAFQFRRKKSN